MIRTLRTSVTAAFALAAVAALTFVLAHPSPGNAAPAKGAAVVSSAASGLGRILVDRRGRTLYLFEKDTKGVSACKGSCAAYWPPVLTTAKPLAGTSVRTALLGTTKRADGTLQVTYNHHPLYTFKLDTRAGQTSGQNTRAFGAEWYVVSPSGTKIDKHVDSGTSPSADGGSTDTPSYDSGY